MKLRFLICYFLIFAELCWGYISAGGVEHVLTEKLADESRLLSQNFLGRKQKRQSEYETNVIPEEESTTETSVTGFEILNADEEYELEHPHDRFETREGDGHIKDVIFEDHNTVLPPIEEWGWNFVD